MKSASIYYHEEKLYFVDNARFSDGIVRKTLEIKVVNRDDCENEMTLALQECFESYKENVELENELDKQYRNKLASMAKCKNYKLFVKESHLIELVYLQNEIKLQPLKSADSYLGYQGFNGIIDSFEIGMLESNGVICRALELFDDMNSFGESKPII
jgi:hypothetical protein